MFLRKVFKYVEPIWSGNDGKISLRSVLSIAFSIDFIRNISHAIYRWDAGRSLEGLSYVLGIEATLIVALLGLKTYQNLTPFGRTGSSVPSQEPGIQKVEGKQPEMVN